MTNTEKSAWVQSLVETYEKPLVSYAYRLSGNLEAARDAVQDTFLRLWQSEPAQLAAHEAQWLYTVCRRRIIDRQRKECRMIATDQVTLEATADPAASVSENLANTEQSNRALELINGLPAKQREVVRLKFHAGLSYREISRITRLSESNVGFLLSTALKTLRQNINATAHL
jgi:RNA polymerase sigma factor (sigma-70 family)